MKGRPPSLAEAAKNATREKLQVHAGETPPLAKFIPDRKSAAAGEKAEPGEAKPFTVDAVRLEKMPAIAGDDVLIDHVGPLASLRAAARIAAAAASKEAWGEWRAVRIRRVADQVELSAGDGRGLFVSIKVGQEPTAFCVRPGIDVYLGAAKFWSIIDAAGEVEQWDLIPIPTGRQEDPWSPLLKGQIAKRLYLHYELPHLDAGVSWPADGRDNGITAASFPGREFRAALRRGGWLHEAERRTEDPAKKPLPLLEGEQPPEFNYGLVRLTIEPAGRKRKGDWLHVEGAAAECHVCASVPATLWQKDLRASMVFLPKHLRSLAAWLSDASDVVVELGPTSAAFSQGCIEVTLPFAQGRFPPIEDRPGPTRNPMKIALQVDELRSRVELACLGLSDLRRDLNLQITSDMLKLTAPAGGKTSVSLMFSELALEGRGGGWAQTTVDGRRLMEALSKLDRHDVVQLCIAAPFDPLTLAADDGPWRFNLMGVVQ